MMTSGNHVANRKLCSCTLPRNLPQFQNDFMAKFFQKKPNSVQEFFLACIESKAWDVATALAYSVNHKQKEFAKFLIENGANVNSTCGKLKNLLHFAHILNHEEFVILLFQNGAFLKPRIKTQKLKLKKV